jgi:hypothetical protein
MHTELTVHNFCTCILGIKCMHIQINVHFGIAIYNVRASIERTTGE